MLLCKVITQAMTVQIKTSCSGRQEDDVTKDWRELYKAAIHNTYSLSNIVKEIKKQVKFAKHVVHIG
jgi:hypothetical protein